MTDFMLSRRALLAGTALGLVAAATPAAARERRSQGKKRSMAAAPEAVKGNQIAYPRLVEVGPGETFDLVAEPATHAFLPGKPVPVLGYGGGYMGPAIRLKRGTTAELRLVNRLDRPTNVHWHGLLVEGEFDGGTHPGVAPGADWRARLRVDQPAATLWYHAHVHGQTTRDIHDGLAGLLLVDDASTAALGLPSTWGVDDLALVLQDRDFDATSRPVRPPLAATLGHGFRGGTVIVNGTAEALAKVPTRPVRLRLLNASGARTFRLYFEDQRTFRLIGTDGGLLPEPIDLTYLPLSAGERAEILVDFAEGASPLMTGPDEHEHRSGATVTTLPDVLTQPVRVIVFDAQKDSHPAATPWTTAKGPAQAPLPTALADLRRRRFELRVIETGPGDAFAAAAMPTAGATDHAAMHHGGHGAAAHEEMGHAPASPGSMAHSAHDAGGPAPRLEINGRAFAPGRIDERVAIGATEIWEIVSPEMAHPFHLHGAHFRVLSEDGGRPKLWNVGAKDTVLVENSAEILVTFARRAGEDAPYLYHCHLLEHEDGGMMGTFTVS